MFKEFADKPRLHEGEFTSECVYCGELLFKQEWLEKPQEDKMVYDKITGDGHAQCSCVYSRKVRGYRQSMKHNKDLRDSYEFYREKVLEESKEIREGKEKCQ